MIERITRVSHILEKKPFATSEYYQHSKESCSQKILVFFTSPLFLLFHSPDKRLPSPCYKKPSNLIYRCNKLLSPKSGSFSLPESNVMSSPISTDGTHSSHSHLDCMPRHWKLLLKKSLKLLSNRIPRISSPTVVLLKWISPLNFSQLDQ